MTNKESGPRADDSHYAAGCTNKLGRPHNLNQRENDHAGGGSDSGDQITSGKSHRANGSLQRRAEHVKREKIKAEMNRVVVQEKSGEEPPKFPFVDNSEEIKRAVAR